MKLNFFPSEYNYSVDGEKLFLQVLLVTFALGFIYIASRSMRIVEKQYSKTSKKITKLKARMDVVLASHEPVTHSVLFHNVARYRRSLVAGYLKDLLNEKQYEPEKFSNFFKDFPETSFNKRTFSSPTAEKIDSVPKNTTYISGNESSPEVSSFDELISSREKNITQNRYYGEENRAKEGRENEFRVMKTPLESKIFKTLEGPSRRLRSSLIEKRKSKIPRWNENLTVCTALTNTRSPFKVKSLAKSPSQRIHLTLKSSYAKHHPEKSNLNGPFVIGNEKSLMEIANQDAYFENEKCEREVASISEASSIYSVGSSGCESECEFDTGNVDQCLQVSFNNGSVRQNTTLTTINEESAEENCPSE